MRIWTQYTDDKLLPQDQYSDEDMAIARHNMIKIIQEYVE